MTENMQYWKKMSRPPLTALKTIKGGRLSGMSNISPQWRWMVMTETFGPIGIGWKYTVEKIWTSPGANDEQFAFSSILLYYKTEEGWSEPIPGEGGSMLVSKELKGMHNNDEAFKMAVTDALGTAMAKIGVGADIYLGTFDGSKYNEPKEFPKQINSKEAAEELAGGARTPVKAPQKPANAPESQNPTEATSEAVKTAQEAVGEIAEKAYTPNQLLAKADLVSEIAEASGKTGKEVAVFVVQKLVKGEHYTPAQIIRMLSEKTGEENA